MPSLAKKQDAAMPSVCIFGDSHLASIKNAMDRGLIDMRGAETEFWGAYGPAFRKLDYRDDAIHPKPEAEEIVAQVNGQGRRALAADDFGAYLFYGARMRMTEYMPPLLETICGQEGHLSAAVRRTLTRKFMRGCRAYRFARSFAAANPMARVAFAPAPLLTEGLAPDAHPGAATATRAERDMLRGWLDEEAARDNVVLLHQPEETITGGYLTLRRYASDESGQEDDPVHKSTEFAAMMVNRFLDLL